MQKLAFVGIKKVMQYISTRLKVMGVSLVYGVMLMFYAYKSEKTPAWAKRIILGAFAYVLSPIDSIPDLTPFIGFTDDLGVISFGLVSVASYIDKEVKEKARKKVFELFTQVQDKDLIVIDKLL